MGADGAYVPLVERLPEADVPVLPVPLPVALGAAAGTNHDSTCVIDGCWHSLSKRSWQF